ncbi:hypothetical protein F5887DRAFT_248465 [Amanita rubescens]|nr:hypothetical protein F5887DRAFT_248465 [Amanita rubescens]
MIPLTSSSDTPSKVDKGRVMILCLDGTGSKPGKRDSNVARFFHALKKDVREKQIVYYQPGLGTYSKHSFFSETIDIVSTVLDLAIALNLNDHIKNGYTFVVQNYRPGDKICLFGFSRGAYTARAIAGMIYKVGLLPKERVQQVDFAFDTYMTTGHEGYKLSRAFKKSFASHVGIEFVGVWDTVSSVGIVPKTHPCTSNNYSVKHFRHALSLDERRAKFRPILWSQETSKSEKDLDVDFPDVRIKFEDSKVNFFTPCTITLADPNKKREVIKNILSGGPNPVPNSVYATRDKWKHIFPNRDHADVKEVWFAGAHADVGGGGRFLGRDTGLSFISLRWMIKECILGKTGIEFDMEYLKNDLDFDIEDLLKEMFERGDYDECYEVIRKCGWDKVKQEISRLNAEKDNNYQVRDDLSRLWYFWGVLECFPMLTVHQDSQGDWFHRRTRNFGRGRYIPFNNNKILVHKSVKKRLENQKLNYVPAAHNWKVVEDMIEYVE